MLLEQTMKYSLYLLLFSILIFNSSCVSKKKVIYFQEIDSLALGKVKTQFEPIIKVDDALYINVAAVDPDASAPFNPQISQGQTGTVGSLQTYRQTYLVDKNGSIQFPVLGTIQVGGLTKEQLHEQLKKAISSYFNNPIITIRIANYKVSVLGEVVEPGVFPIESERITLPEALAMAGDMTLFGRRENVLLIREVDGVKSSVRINMTDPNFVNSQYYYLSQNDVVYVEPNQRKINATAIGPNILAAISILGFAVTTILLLTGS